MGTVEPCPELAADALSQLGCAKTLYSILSYFPFPFCCDGRWAYPCNPLYYLKEKKILVSLPTALKSFIGTVIVLLISEKAEDKMMESECVHNLFFTTQLLFNSVAFAVTSL